MTSSSPPDFATTFASVADVAGWMTRDQAARLWDAAVEVPAGGQIVEIGSFQGRSAIVLATACDPTVTVVAIDPHAGNDRGPQEIEGFEAQSADDHQRFLENLTRAGVRDRVRHVRAFSDVAHPEVEGDIDVLYIDGAHRYAPAVADIRAWGARVRPGGTMLIHDSFSSVGVTLAIIRALWPSATWRYVGRSQSMTEYRLEPMDPVVRRRQLVAQVRQLPWFVRNLAIKVLISVRLGRLTRLLGGDGTWPY